MRPAFTPVVLAALAALALLARPGGAAGPAERPEVGTAPVVEGEAVRLSGGRSEPLEPGGILRAGDTVETRAEGRAELALRDGSAIRLGPRARLALEVAEVDAGADGRVIATRLDAGEVWAKVPRKRSPRARFEVVTSSAVAGVRGTVLRVRAGADGGTVVRVYEGAVSVRPAQRAGPRPERRRVEGPTEVTRAEWERIVTTMMEIRVAPDGRPASPQPFFPDERDAFEAWNRARDAEPDAGGPADAPVP